MNKIFLIEPYYAGSHKALIDLLYEYCNSFNQYSKPIDSETCKLPEFDTELAMSGDRTGTGTCVEPVLAVMKGKKWHWRARTSALYFAQTIPRADNDDHHSNITIFASCVLPLHDLIALRPDLRRAKKIIYFHENQLIYPKQKTKERDFQYGYNQILSCLAADVVLFNSNFNMETFLSNLKPFFKLQPDYRPKDLRALLEPKCKVMYFPINFSKIRVVRVIPRHRNSVEPIRLVWPHRWEHDKNPEMFFRVIYKLIEDGNTNFRLSILGEQFADKPSVFEKAQVDLLGYILNFGFLSSKEEYYDVLCESDIVISTADHEFFGVAMLEAVYCGCYPLCPKALVYPEIFLNCEDSFYSSENELSSKLASIINDPIKFRSEKERSFSMDFTRFDWKHLKTQFAAEFNIDCRDDVPPDE